MTMVILHDDMAVSPRIFDGACRIHTRGFGQPIRKRNDPIFAKLERLSRLGAMNLHPPPYYSSFSAITGSFWVQPSAEVIPYIPIINMSH